MPATDDATVHGEFELNQRVVLVRPTCANRTYEDCIQWVNAVDVWKVLPGRIGTVVAMLPAGIVIAFDGGECFGLVSDNFLEVTVTQRLVNEVLHD